MTTTHNLHKMLLPPAVIRDFQEVPEDPSNHDFLGPYNRMLYMLFAENSEFTVFPERLPALCNSPDPVIMFYVMLKHNPVFALQLKPPSHLQHEADRAAADEQILSCIRVMTGSSSQSLLVDLQGANYLQLCRQVSHARSARRQCDGHPAQPL